MSRDDSRVPPPRDFRNYENNLRSEASQFNNNNNNNYNNSNDNRRDYNSRGGDNYSRGRDWDDRGGERDFKRGRYEDYNDSRSYDSAPSYRRDEHYSNQQQDYPSHQNQHHQQQQNYQQQNQYQAMPYDAPYPSSSSTNFQPPPSHSYQAHSHSNNNQQQQQTTESNSSNNRSLEPPSASVVLLGLPIHVDDTILRNFLEDMGASIDSTTVIMDRITGASKRYGFAKFGSVEHARSFVEPNFPAVTWRERGGCRKGDEGLKIKINYSQKNGGWREDQGANARAIEDKRRLIDSAQAPQEFYINDGTRDIGSSPTQILLLRGLDPLTSEEEIISTLSAIVGRAGNEIREGEGIKKIMITKDRAAKSSWGYAFVQFSDVRLATEVLATAFNPNLYPTGFRIRNAAIAFSFCHENSFIPIYARSEWSFKGEGGQQLIYWDDKAFVNAYIPINSKSKSISNKPNNSNKKEEDKKSKEEELAELDMEAFFNSIEAEVDQPLLESNHVVLVSPSHAKPQIRVPSTQLGIGPGSKNITINLGSIEEDRLKGITKSRKGKEVEKVSSTNAVAAIEKKKSNNDLIQTKKAAVNISKWNTKQQELATVPGSISTPTSASSNHSKTSSSLLPSGSKPISIALSNSISKATTVNSSITDGSTVVAIEDELPFGDTTNNVCLLCQRQFKSIEEIKRHNSLSKLHKDNLTNSTTVSEATIRKSNLLKSSISNSTSNSTEEVPKYVDRAAARREQFGQPDHPLPSSSSAYKKTLIIPPPPPFEEKVQMNKDGIEESNVGSKMLEKMGWSKGAGLGATATGIVVPVEASQFAQGAGIGASAKGVPSGLSYTEGLRERARARLAEEN